MSVFSDAARTTHLPGSPEKMTLDGTLAGMNYLQSGCSVLGTGRQLSGEIDDISLCDYSLITSLSKDLELDVEANGPSRLQIYDMMGKVIQEETLIDQNASEYLAKLEDGMYVVRLKNKSGQKSYKILVRK